MRVERAHAERKHERDLNLGCSLASVEYGTGILRHGRGGNHVPRYVRLRPGEHRGLGRPHLREDLVRVVHILDREHRRDDEGVEV